MIYPITVQRMDNVAIVVNNLDAGVAYFAEFGLGLDGRTDQMTQQADVPARLRQSDRAHPSGVCERR